MAKFIVNNLPANKTYNLFSVFGKPLYLKRHACKNNVFVSGENLNCRFKHYQDYCLGLVGLAMGFDSREEENYLRFPLWLLYVFEPKVDFESIKRIIDDINKQNNRGRYECALISSHDKWNTRAPIYNGLKDILDISCAGSWNNNTTVLWEEFGNDKLAFLKECKFTICPENEDTPHYVTEKIFDCLTGNVVPVYFGAEDICDYVSKDCFIDYRDYGSPQELLDYIISVDEEKYNGYLVAARVNVERLKNRGDFSGARYGQNIIDMSMKATKTGFIVDSGDAKSLHASVQCSRVKKKVKSIIKRVLGDVR